MGLGRPRVQFTLKAVLIAVAVLSCTLGTISYVYLNYVHKPRKIFLAAESGDANTIQELLATGTAVPKLDKFGQTPLMFSCLNGHLAATKVLVEAGAPINERLQHGMTPLMYAAAAGHLKVVEYLFAQGADLTLLTDSGYSALYYAEGNGHSEVVKFLAGELNRKAQSGD